jgi:heme exporter protein CcmD
LVEHAAPAGLGDEARRPVDPSRDPDAAAGDGGALLLLFVVLVLLRTETEIDRRRLLAAELGRVNHTPFIVGSYVVALLGFGGLVIASLLARRRARRELGQTRAGTSHDSQAQATVAAGRLARRAGSRRRRWC